MLEPIIYESPAHKTLFLLEGGRLRIITFAGEEVLFLVSDFVAFLVHVASHPVAALVLVSPPHLRALARALEEGDRPHA